MGALPLELIYCGGGRALFARIATENGFRYGTRLPEKVYQKLYFADQDWKKPDRKKYMEALKEHRPIMATVLDLERRNQIKEVLDWAEEASQYVKKVIIIPKVSKIIPCLPKRINQAEVILGFSVPTKYGGTRVLPEEFGRGPVHLLGGSPTKQMEWFLVFNVVSADGGMAHQQAHRVRFWSAKKGLIGHWRNLREIGDNRTENANHECFRLSCINIRAAWELWCSQNRSKLLGGFFRLPPRGTASRFFQYHS